MPGTCDLEGVCATDNEAILDGGEKKVCAGGEGNKLGGLFVNLRKVHRGGWRRGRRRGSAADSVWLIAFEGACILTFLTFR